MKSKIDGYWINNPKGFFNNYKKRGVINKFLNKRTEIFLEMIGDIQDKDILDVGCGDGIHMKMLENKCKSIKGIDISKKIIVGLPNAIVGNAEKLPFRKNSFDIVYALGLLDYVDNPKKVIEECFRVLKIGGLFIFTYPKKPTFFFLLRGKFGGFIRHYLFSLPRIKNSISRYELHELMYGKFEIEELKSIWTASWIVKSKSFKQENLWGYLYGN